MPHILTGAVLRRGWLFSKRNSYRQKGVRCTTTLPCAEPKANMSRATAQLQAELAQPDFLSSLGIALFEIESAVQDLNHPTFLPPCSCSHITSYYNLTVHPTPTFHSTNLAMVCACTSLLCLRPRLTPSRFLSG